MSMVVRAKVRCITVKTSASNYGSNAGTIESKQVELGPVADPANSTWSKYTPAGSINLTINNPEAFEAFKPGETYFVDFTPAPAKEADEK
jgi:hypothetical protein